MQKKNQVKKQFASQEKLSQKKNMNFEKNPA